VRRPIDGDLALGHRLEQRRLGLRHRAVDLVHEHDVREQRAAPELEVPGLLVVDSKTNNVARLQIGRALHPGEGCTLDATSNRAREHRLAGAGDVLEQDVTLADHCREDDLELVALSAQNRLDAAGQTLGDSEGPLEPPRAQSLCLAGRHVHRLSLQSARTSRQVQGFVTPRSSRDGAHALTSVHDRSATADAWRQCVTNR
jgi:hypothetical protein